jgi:hypothetical protein
MIDPKGGAFGFDCCLASPKFRVFQQPARPCHVRCAVLFIFDVEKTAASLVAALIARHGTVARRPPIATPVLAKSHASWARQSAQRHECCLARTSRRHSRGSWHALPAAYGPMTTLVRFYNWKGHHPVSCLLRKISWASPRARRGVQLLVSSPPPSALMCSNASTSSWPSLDSAS